MPPSGPSRDKNDLFRERLDAVLNMRHPLVRLSGLMPWVRFDEAFDRFYRPVGRPAKPTRLMVVLHYLKHVYGTKRWWSGGWRMRTVSILAVSSFPATRRGEDRQMCFPPNR